MRRRLDLHVYSHRPLGCCQQWLVALVLLAIVVRVVACSTFR